MHSVWPCSPGAFSSNRTPLALVVLIALVAGCDSSPGEQRVVEIPDPRFVAPSDYTVTDSGLKFYDFTVGHGSVPAEDGLVVEFHFNMWLASDSTMVNSSFFTGVPATLVLGDSNIIAGWNEGLTGIRVGGDRQIVIPPALGYGTRGAPSFGIPPDATLIMEVAMLRIGVITQ